MQYEHQIADFAERTLANLDHIQAIAGREDAERIGQRARTAFPTTQLLSALLGLVVFPKERYDRHIPEKTLTELQKVDGWPELAIKHPTEQCLPKRGRRAGDHRECKDLRELTRVIRNGISHCNIECYVDQFGSEIGMLQLSNRCPACNQITTEVTMSVSALESIARSFAEIVLQRAVECDGYKPRRPSVELGSAHRHLTKR